MTTIGFMGLGNLGLPCALAIERYGGHRVIGYDCSERALQPLRDGKFARFEPGVEELLRATKIEMVTPKELARECEIVFVAVQTPHHPKFEGITPLTEERVDFDYRYLKDAVAQIARAAESRCEPLIVNVVSTVLPGTMAREIEPLIGPKCQLSYNPFFIAMGTTIQDFLKPEFVLLGSREESVARRMMEFYGSLHSRPCYPTTVEAAELIKVSYNTFIGLKLAFVNCLMEVCDKVGADVDDVTGALCQATDRLISPRYMKAGMGDGGGCHPRDNIAMSWLARELGLSFDLFEAAMLSREGQTRWFASQIKEAAKESGLPVVILGTAYKADSDLITGSPSLLLIELLKEAGIGAAVYDPVVDPGSRLPPAPALYFVGMPHQKIVDLDLASGSVVIDPWGNQPVRPGVNLRRLGREQNRVISATVDVDPEPVYDLV
jgi:UDPglucose 6-dehydrogenase